MEGRDEELIIRYLEGEDLAFKDLIDKYTNPIYNYSAKFLGKEKAKDITQDIFVKIWKNLKRFDSEKSSFKTWLLTIAHNTIIDQFKKKRMITFSELDFEDNIFIENIKDETILIDEDLQKIEESEDLNKLISELPEKYREVLILHYQEEMTFSEIAEILKKPMNTVKSYHYRALIILKDKFNGR